MEENRKQKPSDFKDIKDNQERLYFKFNSIWDEKRVTPQGLNKEIHEFRILKYLLYTLIITGVIFFILLVSLNIPFIFMIIDIGMVAIYIFYFLYIRRRYYRNLKTFKVETVKNIKRNISIFQFISYSIIFISIIFILIISMVGMNLLDLVVILGISFLFIYLDSRNEDGNTY